jgi:hypothetical protein
LCYKHSRRVEPAVRRSDEVLETTPSALRHDAGSDIAYEATCK